MINDEYLDMKNVILAILVVASALCGNVATAADTYIQLLDKIDVSFKSNDWETSRKLIKSALELEPANPNNYLLLSNLGTVNRSLGNNAEALENYNLALSIAPKSTTILHNRASLLMEMDSTRLAFVDYKQLLEQNPKDLVAQNYIGMIALSFGDMDLAKQSFDNVLQLDANNIDAKRGLALMLRLDERYNEAIAEYDAIIKKENRASNYLSRAECYLAVSDFVKAQADLSEAQKLDPQSPDLYLLKAKLAQQQFRYDDAYKYAQQAVQLGCDEKLASQYAVKKDR